MSKEVKQEHAKLSASASERWLNCAGSYHATKDIPNKSSKYADEGSLAHDVAAKCLDWDLDATDFIGYSDLGHTCNHDMAMHVNKYCEYVRSFTGERFIEKRVDFSHVVPEGFGTADALVFDHATNHLHVIDLKFGRGVSVNAVKNTQGLLYAIGALHDYKQHHVENVSIHIVQPRINNYSEWTLSKEEVFSWHEVFSDGARAALDENAARKASNKACTWCAAKPTCPALFELTIKTFASDIEDLGLLKQKDPTVISDKQTREILDNATLISSYIESVQEHVKNRLMIGESFDGYKLVRGRAARKFRDDAEKSLLERLGESAYNKKLIGITDAEKLLGKTAMSELTYYPEPPIVMVGEEDKREAVGVIKHFDDIT